MTTVYQLGKMRPALPENNDFWIAPNAFVIGNVIMKEGTSVWFGTTIRGDNETVTIMEGTNICLLYTSPSPRDRSLSRMPSSA